MTQEKGMQIKTVIALASIIVLVVIAVCGFTYKQGGLGARINKLENDYVEVKDMRNDISEIKETLVRLTTIIDRKLN